MIKIIKYIFPLFILLFFSNSTLPAHSLITSSANTSSKENTSELTANNSYNYFLSRVTTPIQDLYKKKIAVVDNEEEVPETYSRKIIEKSSYFLNVSLQNAPKTTKNLLAFSKFSPNLPSHNSSLYLLFKVFRI